MKLAFIVNKQIGDRIRAIRISKNLYPKDVGAEIGMLQTSYSKIERGGNTSVKTILKIAKVLEVSAAEFFEGVQIVADPVPKMGYATKEDFENLKQVVDLLLKKVEELFPENQGLKHYPSRIKKTSRNKK